MTSEISTPRHVRMNLSRAAPSAKFQLGAEVFFNVPTIEDPSGLIFGTVIARHWGRDTPVYMYTVDEGQKIWYNVPESQLQQVEKLPVSKE